MCIGMHRLAVVAVVLTVAALPSAVQAQAAFRTAPTAYVRVVVSTAGGPIAVWVPDGGSASLGGYSQMSESRREFGPPGVGQLPYAGRVVRNVGYGRDTVSGRVGVSVRIIDLREEEFRQTGFRSP